MFVTQSSNFWAAEKSRHELVRILDMGFVWLHGKELLLYVLLSWAISLAAFFGIGYLIIKLIERKKK